MGPCATGSTSRTQRALPVVFGIREDSLQQHGSTDHQFIFKLMNVSIVPIFKTNINLVFEIQDLTKFEMLNKNMRTQKYQEEGIDEQKQRFEITWNQINTTQFTFSQRQLANKYLTVYLGYNGQPPVDILRINLYLIVHGPFHHNISIPLEQQYIRLLFDAKVSHIFEAKLAVKQLILNTPQQLAFSNCHFTLKAQNEEDVLNTSSPSYSLKSSIGTILQSNQVMVKEGVQTGMPRNKLRHSLSMEQSINHEVRWKTRGDKEVQNHLPSLTFDISTNDVTQYFLHIVFWDSREGERGTSDYLCQVKIPVWKMLDKEFTQKKNSLVESIKLKKEDLNNSTRSYGTDSRNRSENVENRKVKLTEKVYDHQDYIGTCEIWLNLQNQKLIEQTKYLSRTEEGIVNKRPAALQKNIKSDNKTIHQLWKYSDQIEQILKKATQKNEFERLESEISQILNKIAGKLLTCVNQVLYADANKNQSLINNQNAFLGMLQKLFPFIENTQNPFLSEICWSIIISILKRSEFTLQNLSLKGKFQSEEALVILKKKTEIALNYQSVLSKLMRYALKGYGLYHNNSSMLTCFLSFAYFRLPSFRQYFLTVIDFEENYAKMEENLLVFQKQIEPKTSFSNTFAEIKGDWKKNFYDELAENARSKKMVEELNNEYRSKRWFMEISYRDETLYDFISQLFGTLSKDSSQRADKWKYIEGYSKIVAIIMTEMTQRQINKYNLGLIRSSIELLQNEHLINQMLPLVCEKANVYDPQSTHIMLDLIDEFFQMVTKKRTTHFPNSFNQNYFFKVVRRALEGQGDNFFIINRFLVIIYNYFQFLSSHGKYQIACYLMGHVFFKLYFHWSRQIRNTFYLFLLAKVKNIMHPKGHQILSQYHRVKTIIKVIEKVHSSQIYDSRQRQLYKKMRNKIKKMMKQKKQISNASRHKYSLENIIKNLDQDATLMENLENRKQNIVVLTPQKNRRSQEIVQNGQNLLLAEPPYIKHHALSCSVVGQEQPPISNKHTKSNLELPEELVAKHSDDPQQNSARKKRRPSIYIEGGVSPQGQKHHYATQIANQLYDLSELTDSEIRHIGEAQLQMEEVVDWLNKYIKTQGEPPQTVVMNAKQLKE